MYERILVGTDGSHTASIAVRRGVEVAVATGATLTVVSVGSAGGPRAAVEEKAARHAGSGVTTRSETASGGPASVLVVRTT